MSAMSNYLENKLVDHILRAQAFSATSPTDVFIALYTAAPSDAGGGTEVSGNGYTRATVARSLTTWKSTQNDNLASTTGTGGATSNTNAINFPTPSGSWGTITHFAILDALTGGNFLFTGALTVQQTVNTGNTVSFAAGQLVITFA